MAKQLLTSNEASEYTGFSRPSLERAWRDGALIRTVLKTSPDNKRGATRYHVADLDRWLASMRDLTPRKNSPAEIKRAA